MVILFSTGWNQSRTFLLYFLMYHERLWQSCVVPHSEYGNYIVCKCAVNIYISGITYYVKLWAFYVCLSYPVFCITYYIFRVTVTCKVCPSWHSPVCDWMTHYFLCIYCIVFVYIVMKWHITFYVYIAYLVWRITYFCYCRVCAPRGTALCMWYILRFMVYRIFCLTYCIYIYMLYMLLQSLPLVAQPSTWGMTLAYHSLYFVQHTLHQHHHHHCRHFCG